MANIADLNVDLLHSGSRREYVAACTSDGCLMIWGMDFFFHTKAIICESARFVKCLCRRAFDLPFSFKHDIKKKIPYPKEVVRMREEGGAAVTVVSIGDSGHLAICWAERNLEAKNIKVVQDKSLALIFRAKRPGAQAELKNAVMASIKASRASIVVVASQRKGGSISEKAQTGGLFRAMHTVKSWGLPIEKIIGIRFDEKGVEMQAGTLEYMHRIMKVS